VKKTTILPHFCLSQHLTLLVGRQEGHLACKNTGCWFVGGDDLTGALHEILHDVSKQLNKRTPNFECKCMCEHFLVRLLFYFILLVAFCSFFLYFTIPFTLLSELNTFDLI